MTTATNSDVIIVGGGIIGLLTALELQSSGATVTVIEKNQTGKESSWAGGGILSPLYPWRYSDAVNALAQWSQSIYQNLAEALLDKTGIDPQWTQSGLIISGQFNDDDVQLVQAWKEKFAANIQTPGNNDLEQIQPGLNVTTDNNQQQAFYLPEVAQVRNPRFVKALKKSLSLSDINLIESSEVTELLIDNGRATGVSTPAGNYFADHTIIASGAWSSSLLTATNINLEVKPVRGQMLLIKATPELLTRMVLDNDRYLIPRRDGRILIGSTLEDVGFDKSTTETAYASLLTSAKRILPALVEYPIEHHWAGLRPGSNQGIPVISAHPDISGLYINAGHYRNGVVLGPASARLMHDIVTKNCTIVDPLPYSL